MTRKEVELALLQIGQQIKDIAEAECPEANQVCVDVVDGMIFVRACVYEGEGKEIKDILNAHKNPNGTLYVNGEYIWAEEVSA